ncbi:hypothetical protein BGZ76_006748 [Entomortierella beljakovae]|nr:hypothetical protein BGZ76_006748 [Entomortierella beljakovae]
MSHSYTKVPNIDDVDQDSSGHSIENTVSSSAQDSNGDNNNHANEIPPLTSGWTELEDENESLLQPMTPLAGSSQQQQQRQQQQRQQPKQPSRGHSSGLGDKKRNGFERLLGPFLSTASSTPSSSTTTSNNVVSTSAESSIPASASGSSAPPRRLPHMLTSDGVFSNIPAKPQVDTSKQEDDEQYPPAYDSAVQDITPPYFEMTVSSPSDDDDEILVNGLPVGNFFQFAWNVLVSVGFQFLGVMLTYLLHNSHASKAGSMVGLGITLLNFGLRMSGNLNSMLGDDTGGAGEVTQVDKPPFVDDTGYIIGNSGYEADSAEMDWLEIDMENRYISLILIFAGWIIIVKALAEYATAKRTERFLRDQPEENRDLESEHIYVLSLKKLSTF